MANTQPVNFRADALLLKQTKAILKDKKITLSDVLNATLRKVTTGVVNVDEFVSSDMPDAQMKVAFEDLKKEILLGHQDIQAGRVTALSEVRKEFGLD